MMVDLRATITFFGVDIELHFVDAISKSEVWVIFTLNHTHILVIAFCRKII